MSPDPRSVFETEALPDIPANVLVDESRRVALGLLPTLSQPVPERTLARHVGAVLNEVDLDAVSEATVDEHHFALHHNHLPKLEAAGLVAHESAAGTVTLTERIEADTPLLAPKSQMPDDRLWTALSALQQNDRRERLLDVLGEHENGLSRMALAMELRERDEMVETDGGFEPLAERSAVERLEVSLHHVDLPKLADVGLLTYDPETAMVEPGDDELVAMLTR